MRLQVSNFKRPDAAYLQGVGHATGTPAGALKVGDTMVWNNRATSRVHAIIKETASFIWIDEVYVQDGELKHYERKLKKIRIVARPFAELNNFSMVMSS